MKTLSLDLRHYYLPRRAEITENEFHHRTLPFQFQTNEIALILVDVWSDHYVKTHLQRGRDITLTRIKPLIEAFESVGATIVHAPSPDCARKYPGWTGYAGDREIFGRSSSNSHTWPPAEFRKKAGEYEKWARPQDPSDSIFDAIIKNRSIIPEVEPQPGQDVILTGDQLHRLLSHRKILHLFYAGFAANMCVPFRDYGMRAMKDRGYDITLIRDCTTAIEVADTAEGLDLTRAAVVDTELNIGYTVSSEALIGACQNAGN